MKIELLEKTVKDMKDRLEHAVTTASYKGEPKEHGRAAKNALIRSHTLIEGIHMVAKQSIADELSQRDIDFEIYPPLESSKPELKLTGFIKGKKQDVTVLLEDPNEEIIESGPLEGNADPVGEDASEKSLVVNVRSQLTSIDKNFDTLMERAFAETLNLRLRLPDICIGEVYLLPINAYDDEEMKNDNIAWKDDCVAVERFIKTFNAITGVEEGERNLYKYDRSALVLVDFQKDPPDLITSKEDLIATGSVDSDFEQEFAELSPVNFAQDIVDSFLERRSES
jgi:hypothetical protein